MIRRLAISLLAVLLLASNQLAYSQVSKPFDPKSYPAESFQVTHHDYPIGKFTVRIIQVKALDDATSTNPQLCRAWLEVKDGAKVLHQAYFDDIDAVGGDYGIFLPEHQPLADYFLALKAGDYEPRLLLVGKDGSLANLLGGALFLTPDRRFIFGTHDFDSEDLFVIDVVRRRVVLNDEKEKLPGVDEWYMDRAGYFFVALGDDGMPQGYGADSKPETLLIYRLDLKSLTVKKGTIAAERLKLARRVKYVPWANSDDCTSEP